jgi:hypothetical protein
MMTQHEAFVSGDRLRLDYSIDMLSRAMAEAVQEALEEERARSKAPGVCRRVQ